MVGLEHLFVTPDVTLRTELRLNDIVVPTTCFLLEGL